MRTIIQPRIVKWLRDHPDVVYHISDIAKELGLEENQVSNATGRVVASGEFPVEQKTRGFYIWHSDGRGPAIEPEKPKVPTMFEFVGTRKDGALIARGEDGKLYELREF